MCHVWGVTRWYSGDGCDVVLTLCYLREGHHIPDTGNMEVFINHHNSGTWQGLIPCDFVSAYLTSLPSAKVSDSAHYQQISPTCSRPTQL